MSNRTEHREDAALKSLLKKSTSLYVIQAGNLECILSHRLSNGAEQYLVRWRTEVEPRPTARAICSWHSLEELTPALPLVQQYLNTRNTAISRYDYSANSLPAPNPRKRKAPGAEPSTSRDAGLGTVTPFTSSDSSRASSVVSRSSAADIGDDTDVYNGYLERREGVILAKSSKRPHIVTIDADTLPTPRMRDQAAKAPVAQAEKAIRKAFYNKLSRLPSVSLENTIDTSTPSLDFTFIREYILGSGVYRAPFETAQGCLKPCKPNMGGFCGCEYPRLCACLEFAAVHMEVLEKSEPERFQAYQRMQAGGPVIDTTGMPKRFPYHKAKGEGIPQTLVGHHLESRNAIYECNAKCNCGPVCKSRVVQKGRKVPLTIFKTANRGWGLRCKEDLVRGEFIDTYLGEVITNQEADLRESQTNGLSKSSYLYSLDKFVGDDPNLTYDNCYVVDGEKMGGVTRFINHSCEPNCRQFTVSYNKHDLRVYDLAFFALEDIPAGRELTFDYVDPNEEEEDEIVRKREEAANDPNNIDKIRCNCGAARCRGYLWV